MEVNDLTIKMTNKCNKNCFYCFSDANSGKLETELSVSEIKEAIDIIKPRRATAFSGGEPLLRYDDVLSLLPYGHKYSNRIRIETNACLDYIDINDFKTNISGKDVRFNVSMDGFKELCDKQRGEGTFIKVLDFSKKAIENDHIVFLKATLEDDMILNNIDYLIDFSKFCKNVGYYNMRIGQIKSCGRGINKSTNDLSVLRKMKENVDYVNYKVTGGVYQFIIPEFCMQCDYKRRDLVLDTDGMLYLECSFLKVPMCHYKEYTPEKHEIALNNMKNLHYGCESGIIYNGEIGKLL